MKNNIKTILIYSNHGAATLNCKILSQACFLKEQGFDVKVLDINNNAKFVTQIATEANAAICLEEMEQDIISKINYLCKHSEELKTMKQNTYKFAKESFNYDNYSKALVNMIKNI